MKIPSLAAALLVTSLTPVFGYTEADVAPAALVGKTLTFAINQASGAFADEGTWTGKFETSPANGFTITNLTGNTTNLSTTRTASFIAGSTVINLTEFNEGTGTLVIFLYPTAATYQMLAPSLAGAIQTGTFTIGSAIKSPEISVLSGGNKLIDGTAKVGFGTVKLGKSVTEKFVIKNTGKAKLSGLAVTKNGTNKADFSVGALPKTSLDPGASMTFNVKFKPSSKGKKSAAIHLKSNNADENPFDIKLTGAGAK